MTDFQNIKTFMAALNTCCDYSSYSEEDDPWRYNSENTHSLPLKEIIKDVKKEKYKYDGCDCLEYQTFCTPLFNRITTFQEVDIVFLIHRWEGVDPEPLVVFPTFLTTQIRSRDLGRPIIIRDILDGSFNVMTNVHTCGILQEFILNEEETTERRLVIRPVFDLVFRRG